MYHMPTYFPAETRLRTLGLSQKNRSTLSASLSSLPTSANYVSHVRHNWVNTPGRCGNFDR